MKKSLLAVAVLGALSGTAFADTNVTLYGLLDVALRHDNNEAGASGPTSKTFIDQGNFNGSRFGLKGTEDLGGGTSAIFKLEAGLVLGQGVSDQQGQLFGRAAWVGLSDKTAGTFTVGRRYNITFETLGNYEVMGWGNYNENSWELPLIGVRTDNSIRYSNNFGSPVTVDLQYSPGGTPGSSSIGTTEGFSVNYAQGPLGAGAVWQESKDAASKKESNVGFGASYDATVAKAFFHYVEAKRDPGFVKGASLAGAPLSNTSFSSNAGNTLTRTDKFWELGVSVPTGATSQVLGGYMYDKVTDINSTGIGGKISTLFAYYDYNFSKRTDVYAGLDHSNLKDGSVSDGHSPIGTFAGQATRTGYMVGMRHFF